MIFSSSEEEEDELEEEEHQEKLVINMKELHEKVQKWKEAIQANLTGLGIPKDSDTDI